jgi:hypothetical protein
MLLKPTRHREASAEADGQFGDFDPLEEYYHSAFHESFFKSDQNRSQKTFYEFVFINLKYLSKDLIILI